MSQSAVNDAAGARTPLSLVVALVSLAAVLAFGVLQGVMILRPYGALLYFNADAVRRRILDLHTQEGAPPRVVLTLSAVPGADLAGAKLLREIKDELAARGAALELAKVNVTVYDTLKALDLDRALGVSVPHRPIREAIEARPASGALGNKHI